jgi:hypothetical protein
MTNADWGTLGSKISGFVTDHAQNIGGAMSAPTAAIAPVAVPAPPSTTTFPLPVPPTVATVTGAAIDPATIATQLGFSMVFTGGAGTCQKVTLNMKNFQGVATGYPTTISLTASALATTISTPTTSTLSLYSNSACSTALSTLSIAAGSNTVDFYYFYPTVNSKVVFQVAPSDSRVVITPAVQNVQFTPVAQSTTPTAITPPTTTALKFSTIPSGFRECDAVTVTAVNAAGTAVVQTSGLALNFALSNASTPVMSPLRFYNSNANCLNDIGGSAAANILSGASAANIYFRSAAYRVSSLGVVNGVSLPVYGALMVGDISGKVSGFSIYSALQAPAPTSAIPAVASIPLFQPMSNLSINSPVSACSPFFIMLQNFTGSFAPPAASLTMPSFSSLDTIFLLNPNGETLGAGTVKFYSSLSACNAGTTPATAIIIPANMPVSQMLFVSYTGPARSPGVPVSGPLILTPMSAIPAGAPIGGGATEVAQLPMMLSFL